MIYSPRVHWKNNSCFYRSLAVFLFFLLVHPFWVQAQEGDLQSSNIKKIWEKLGASGSLRSSYWQKDKSFSQQKDFTVGSAWLSLRPEDWQGYKFFAEGFIQGQDFSRSNYADADLREAYIEKSWKDFDFKVGRAITVWGRADKVNPTDQLSVKNLQRLLVDDEESRMGLLTVQTVYNSDNTRWIFLWIPEWRSPVYPIAPIRGIELQDTKPDLNNPQWAVKMDQSGNSVDWSLSYFDGYSKTPDLSVLSANAGGTTLGLQYGRVKVYGADLATNVGDYGLRGEVAYTKTNDTDGTNYLLANSNVYAVLGADRSFMEHLNINAQLLYRHIDQFQDPAGANSSLQTVAMQQAVNTSQQFKDQTGLSLRPSYKALNDTLELEVAYVTWFNKNNSLLRPKINYAWSDHLRTSLGGEYYNGPADSFFGRLQDVSSAYFELKLLF
ncbi:MAG: hypothetical protein ACOYOK_07975 [Pseudobdellovibrionaceae bacterium]